MATYLKEACEFFGDRLCFDDRNDAVYCDGIDRYENTNFSLEFECYLNRQGIWSPLKRQIRLSVEVLARQRTFNSTCSSCLEIVGVRVTKYGNRSSGSSGVTCINERCDWAWMDLKLIEGQHKYWKLASEQRVYEDERASYTRSGYWKFNRKGEACFFDKKVGLNLVCVKDNL